MFAGLLIATVACSVLTSGQSTPVPDPLMSVAAERGGIFKGEVDFEWRSRLWNGQTRFYTSRFAGDDHLLIWHGDEEGVLYRDAEGRPQPNSFGPNYSLAHNGLGWVVRDGALQGEAREQGQMGGFVIDARSLGLTVQPPLHGPEQALGVSDEEASHYDIKRERDMEIVTQRKGEFTTRWWLDTRRGGLPVRVVAERQGQLLREARSKLVLKDGRWFPELIEFFEPTCKGGKEPAEVISVRNVRLEAPDLPDEITPRDIGVDAGFNVTRYDLHMQDRGQGIWDGEGIVSIDEYADRVRRGEIQPGAVFTRNAMRLERLRQAREVGIRTGPEDTTPALRRWESAWDKYVREFCERYSFNDDQRQHASRLLESCKRLGQEYVARKQFSFRAWELSASRLAKRTEHNPQLEEQLEAQKLRLLMPLDEIFEERLKPGLEKLPTREQRRRADGPSKP